MAGAHYHRAVVRVSQARGEGVAVERHRGQGEPVFVHSSFRTSSTWLWTKFRADPRALAYNEIFNDLLARLTVESALTHDSAAWRSGHPATDPYFLEFIPLIAPSGGVIDYRVAMAIDTAIPAGGVGGDITADEARYVGGLIAQAGRQGRIPVLTDTRTLGRLSGLQRAFGGTHIFLYRNLFDQWNSYTSQHYSGNPFFVNTIVDTLRHHNGDPFIKILHDYMDGECGYDPDDWIKPKNSGRLFIVFCALHLYWSMAAWQAADLTVSVDAIAADPAQRCAIESQVRARCGLTIDLGDVRLSVQAPVYPLADSTGAWRTIAILFACAAGCPPITVDAANFGRALMDESRRASGGDAAFLPSPADHAAFFARLLYFYPEDLGYLRQLQRLYAAQGRSGEARALEDRAARLASSPAPH